MFSIRVIESSVQFSEPVQTASRSRTMYLWCMRVRWPRIARSAWGGKPSSCTRSCVSLGAGSVPRSSTLAGGLRLVVARVVGEPDLDAGGGPLPQRFPQDAGGFRREAAVVDGEIEPLPRPLDERRHPTGHGRRVLCPLLEKADRQGIAVARRAVHAATAGPRRWRWVASGRARCPAA